MATSFGGVQNTPTTPVSANTNPFAGVQSQPTATSTNTSGFAGVQGAGTPGGAPKIDPWTGQPYPGQGGAVSTDTGGAIQRKNQGFYGNDVYTPPAANAVPLTDGQSVTAPAAGGWTVNDKTQGPPPGTSLADIRQWMSNTGQNSWLTGAGTGDTRYQGALPVSLGGSPAGAAAPVPAAPAPVDTSGFGGVQNAAPISMAAATTPAVTTPTPMASALGTPAGASATAPAGNVTASPITTPVATPGGAVAAETVKQVGSAAQPTGPVPPLVSAYNTMADTLAPNTTVDWGGMKASKDINGTVTLVAPDLPGGVIELRPGVSPTELQQTLSDAAKNSPTVAEAVKKMSVAAPAPAYSLGDQTSTTGYATQPLAMV